MFEVEKIFMDKKKKADREEVYERYKKTCAEHTDVFDLAKELSGEKDLRLLDNIMLSNLKREKRDNVHLVRYVLKELQKNDTRFLKALDYYDRKGDEIGISRMNHILRYMEEDLTYAAHILKNRQLLDNYPEVIKTLNFPYVSEAFQGETFALLYEKGNKILQDVRPSDSDPKWSLGQLKEMTDEILSLAPEASKEIKAYCDKCADKKNYPLRQQYADVFWGLLKDEKQGISTEQAADFLATYGFNFFVSGLYPWGDEYCGMPEAYKYWNWKLDEPIPACIFLDQLSSTDEISKHSYRSSLDEKIEDIVYLLEHDSPQNIKKMVYGLMGTSEENEITWQKIRENPLLKEKKASKITFYALFDKEQREFVVEDLLAWQEENGNVDLVKELKKLTNAVSRKVEEHNAKKTKAR